MLHLLNILSFPKVHIFWEGHKISTVDLTGTTWDKSTLEISQNCVAFSEYMNFTYLVLRTILDNLYRSVKFLTLNDAGFLEVFFSEKWSLSYQIVFQVKL